MQFRIKQKTLSEMTKRGFHHFINKINNINIVLSTNMYFQMMYTNSQLFKFDDICPINALTSYHIGKLKSNSWSQISEYPPLSFNTAKIGINNITFHVSECSFLCFSPLLLVCLSLPPPSLSPLSLSLPLSPSLSRLWEVCMPICTCINIE